MKHFEIEPNVFRADISADYVDLGMAVIDSSQYEKPITDDMIIKQCIVRLDPEQIMGLVGYLLSVAVDLQEKFGVDLGFVRNDEEDQDHTDLE